MKPITEVDTSNESVEYWNDILRSHGLSMERGKRPNLVVPVGGLFVLNKVDEKQLVKETGKREPEGYGPDK